MGAYMNIVKATSLKDNNIKLSDYFYLSEFAVYKTHPSLANQITFNNVEIERLRLLCESCLVPIRRRFGPINILSGKRHAKLNQAVGGSKISDHLYCTASDIHSNRVEALEIYKWILENELHYRQVIYYPKDGFVHISINAPGKTYKHQQLVYENGVYYDWNKRSDMINL